MSIRKHAFVIGEYYHVYNRGVDKRNLLLDSYDLQRFLQSLKDFNAIKPIGSIYELSFRKEKLSGSAIKSNRLVSIIAYCINPNHFHLILTPLIEKGIEKFMQRIGGYTRYFNEKYKRNGTLFQGKFKSKLIEDNNYLLHLSAYVNMNNQNSLVGLVTKNLSKSSLEEYTKNKKGICDKDIVLKQFKNEKDYLRFILESWQDTQKRKKDLKI